MEGCTKFLGKLNLVIKGVLNAKMRFPADVNLRKNITKKTQKLLIVKYVILTSHIDENYKCTVCSFNVPVNTIVEEKSLNHFNPFMMHNLQ